MSKQTSQLHEEEAVPKKTKRNKHEADCDTKRRGYNSCGICGSNDVLYECLIYCKVCGKEEFTITDSLWWLWPLEGNRPEPCNEHFFSGHHGSKIRDSREIRVAHCIACGATNGPKCPNCQKKIWTKGLSKYCKSCGLRRDQ